jgi:hypothetical protein
VFAFLGEVDIKISRVGRSVAEAWSKLRGRSLAFSVTGTEDFAREERCYDLRFSAIGFLGQVVNVVSGKIHLINLSE